MIDPSKIQAEKVVFGATVTLVDEDGKQRRYQIVGEPEADLEKGKISVSSPISRALLGKLAGDEAIVRSPKGEVVYEVSKVEYI